MRATSVITLNSSDSSMQVPELVAAAQNVLLQAQNLMEHSTESQYAQVARSPFSASVGAHYRHVLEHFHCLMAGLSSGEVNYDARRRDPRIENELAFAQNATRDVLQEFQKWTENTLHQKCRTVSSVAYHFDSESYLDSNIGRELAYCIGHAIHHYAIIRLICSEVGVVVPPEFGYAPSTLKHQSSMAAD